MADSRVLVMLLLLAFKTTMGTNSTGEIVTDPRSVNVSLSSVARFTCEGRGDILLWTINGLAENHNNRGQLVLTQTNATTGLLMSMIEIPANPANNDIRIVCTAIGTPFNDMSDTAILRIQGLLPQVMNLAGIFRNFSMQVSWEPPTTLEGVPIIGYNVTVHDAAATHLVIYSNTMLTATSFQVSGAELQACHNYTTTVVANNVVGQGNETSFTLGTSVGGYPGVPQIIISNMSVLVRASDDDSNRFVNITAEAVGECSQQYPTEVIVYLKSTTNSETAVNLTTISSNSAVLSGLTNAVPSDKRYTLDVTVTNTAGSISSTSTTTINTFDTQILMFGRTTTNLACFRCSFLEGSRAVGCLVQSPSGINLRSTRLASDDHLSQWNCSDAPLRQTVLTITVFDIESNGTASTEPALSLESVSATIDVDIPAASSTGGVVLPPTSRPVAPSSDIIPLVSAIVAVIFIITLFGVGIVVMAVVLIRRKAHIQDINQRLQRGNCKCEDVIFTEANPVYECSQEAVISTAMNPLYGGLGAPPVVTNGPVYDTVGNTTEECKPHLVCNTASEPSKPAAEAVYETVGGKLSLKDPPPDAITPYASIPNNYITTKH